MAKHINIAWAESPEKVVTNKSWSRKFARLQMPSMSATGKKVSMKWTGPAESMLEQMRAIHDPGSMQQVSEGTPGVGYLRARPDFAVDKLQKIFVGGVAVTNSTPYPLSWTQWCTLIGYYTACTASASTQTVEVIEVEAVEPGESGNNIRLHVGAPSARADVSGMTLTGGSMQTGAIAGVDMQVGEPSDAGSIEVDGVRVELPSKRAHEALPATGLVMFAGDWDTPELTVEVAGVEVHGGGQGLVGNINAMRLGVRAEAGAFGEPYIVLTAESDGDWGNNITVNAWHDGDGYAVSHGEHLTGGCNEGWRPAEQAWGWIGADSSTGLDWAEDAQLWVNGIEIVREEGERLYQALNRYTGDGLLGNSGVIAEPREYIVDPAASTAATGWIEFAMAPAASGWLRINGVAIDLGIDSASPSEWAAAINEADCGVSAMRRGDTAFVDLTAEVAGAAGNSIRLDSSVGGSQYEPTSGEYLTGGEDAVTYRTHLFAAEPGATGNDIMVTLRLGGAYAGHEDVGGMRDGADAAAQPARTQAELLDALRGLESERVHVEADSTGGYRVSAATEGAWGNELAVVASGCFTARDGEYDLTGGVDAGAVAARGTIRIYDWANNDVGLYIDGKKVTWAAKGQKPGVGMWDNAINATGVVRVASHTQERQQVVTITAKAVGPDTLEVGYSANAGELTCYPVKGGTNAEYEVNYSEAGAPVELELQPYPNSEKSGYCWEIVSTCTRMEGEMAELNTEWSEVWYQQEEEREDEEDETDKDKTEEDKLEEDVGESEDNPEIIIDTTAVLESILTHPAAKQYTEAQLMACHAYMSGKGLDDKIVVKGKKRAIRDIMPTNWLADLIKRHVWEYNVPHTVVRKQWKGRGKTANVCEIGHASGLPAAGKDRNWMCMGSGIEKRGTEVIKSETWELSNPGGWNKQLYGGES